MIIDNPNVKEHFLNLKKQLTEALQDVEKIINKEVPIQTPDDLANIENEIINQTDKLAGLILGCKIQESLISNHELKQETTNFINTFPKKMKNQGIRDIEISPLRGEPFKVKTEYFTQKAKKDKRKKKRTGCYPALTLLGIFDKCTPMLSSEIALMATALSSFEEAQSVLHERGRDIDVKTIRNITIRFSERCRLEQLTESCEIKERVEGCSVVVSTDGGRIRIREKKRGPKTKKGRNHYKGAWREPKVLIIYVVREDGRMERTFSPFIDGTLKGPNAVFSMIQFYLEKLGICSADKILFVADGARWIWNRVEQLMRSLGIKKWFELLDFYHAVEHLGKISKFRKGWKTSEKERWVKKYRKLLINGKSNEVIGEIKRICKGKRGKKLLRERDYFIRNQKRLNFEYIKNENLPIGSGAMESSIRRVINMRLKGAATYWLRENAEKMLMLRCYFTSGRWDVLKRLAFSSKHILEV
jgi:hypothetical protein